MNNSIKPLKKSQPGKEHWMFAGKLSSLLWSDPVQHRDADYTVVQSRADLNVWLFCPEIFISCQFCLLHIR